MEWMKLKKPETFPALKILRESFYFNVHVVEPAAE